MTMSAVLGYTASFMSFTMELFIKDVHVQYPNTLIACIEPIIDSWFDDKPLLTGIVDGQEQAVNDMNDDKAIY